MIMVFSDDGRSIREDVLNRRSMVNFSAIYALCRDSEPEFLTGVQDMSLARWVAGQTASSEGRPPSAAH